MIHHDLGNGRYVLRLDTGDELVACLRQFAGEVGAQSGMITGLGAVSAITLGFLDPETGEYIKRRYDEPMEVANLTGTLSVEAEDGRPFVHLHAVVAPRELIAYAGHVFEAWVGPVVEAIVTTFDTKLERHNLPDKAFPWLRLPQEDDQAGAEPPADG